MAVLVVMGRTDNASSLEATSSDWRATNLRSAYRDILDEEAFEYELDRFRHLQKVKRQKIAIANAEQSYKASLRGLVWMIILWTLYTHIFFRLQHAVPFVVLRFLARPGVEVPPLHWPFESRDSWLMRRVVFTPSLLILFVAIYHALEALRKRIWESNKQLALMVIAGAVVIFISLVLGC